ncbi:acetyltransferase [Vibrio ichthyoenteri ATCC 700023]|uniref:Acetyltransferase n=1 Tax=Vibrio ichthyoenteri ATCC 700023 TaxID=870968 RepID=F9RYV0_9VIBR|nr:sugar O-acetyltransferase [Vibrio ichthyoenteri]EGU46310.1 acetyltransferase [Vibrio ichthyoenteri ATCC 700023]
MKTEKQKMLAGEPYQAWDETLYAERIACRKTLQQLNNSLPDTEQWREAIDRLIPNAQGAYIEPPFRCDYGENIVVGKNFFANFNCVVLDVAKVTIGDNVLFGPNIQLYTAGHPLDVKGRVEEGIEFGLPITIGDNVWLGGSVVVCPGITIGENSVVGAGSVVTKDIPANVVAAGNPCRVIRPLDASD